MKNICSHTAVEFLDWSTGKTRVLLHPVLIPSFQGVREHILSCLKVCLFPPLLQVMTSLPRKLPSDKSQEPANLLSCENFAWLQVAGSTGTMPSDRQWETCLAEDKSPTPTKVCGVWQGIGRPGLRWGVCKKARTSHYRKAACPLRPPALTGTMCTLHRDVRGGTSGVTDELHPWDVPPCLPEQQIGPWVYGGNFPLANLSPLFARFPAFLIFLFPACLIATFSTNVQ